MFGQTDRPRERWAGGSCEITNSHELCGCCYDVGVTLSSLYFTYIYIKQTSQHFYLQRKRCRKLCKFWTCPYYTSNTALSVSFRTMIKKKHLHLITKLASRPIYVHSKTRTMPAPRFAFSSFLR